jgi:hypothetical protein
LFFIFGHQKEVGWRMETITMFGASHSHRVWRMMDALIDAQPEWADAEVFEQARERMLRYGTSIGMTLEELFKITDPDIILGLCTAAEASEVQE